jgi:hypothetical protein
MCPLAVVGALFWRKTVLIRKVGREEAIHVQTLATKLFFGILCYKFMVMWIACDACALSKASTWDRFTELISGTCKDVDHAPNGPT